MYIEVDVHTHTLACGHAFSTIVENAAHAAKKKLKALVLTDHGPAMPMGPPSFYFGAFDILPEEIEGVRIIKGVEANIIGAGGELDLPLVFIKKLEFVIASLHDVCIPKGTRGQNTETLCAALANPYVDMAAHPGNPYFEVDIEKVVLCAKHFGKIIEINNHSFEYRRGCEGNCREFARLCRKHGVRVAVSSDAHICFEIGRFERALELLESVGMPEELVVNSTLDRFMAYLDERRARLAGIE